MSNAVRPCYQSSVTHRACAKCGAHSMPVHLPTRQVGYYCADCCPACNPKPQPGKKEE